MFAQPYSLNRKGKLSPAKTIVMGFLLVIIIGTVCLSLPIASKSNQGLGFVDSLFTATSATCVTALSITTSTLDQFTMFGQIVILLLIQIGGIGIMTVSTLLFLILGKRIGFQNRIMLQESYNQFSMAGIVKLAKYLIITTLCLEGIGALILAIRFSFDMSLSQSVYYGIFHSISAFCNAGFNLLGHTPSAFINLGAYSSDYLVRTVIMLLIVLGGLGFPVIMELLRHKKSSAIKGSLHTKMVLIISAILIFTGAMSFFFLEYNNPATLGGMDMANKIFNSFFSSISFRTGGFGLGHVNVFNTATLYITMLLMFIGASPSSTGGGIKTTTIGIILASVVSTIRGYDETVIAKKRIPQETINKGLIIISLSFTILFVSMLLLSLTENIGSLDILFETISALSTTGLSTGVTHLLSNFGRILIAILMFVGRLGPVTVAGALSQRNKVMPVHYAEEKIIIG